MPQLDGVLVQPFSLQIVWVSEWTCARWRFLMRRKRENLRQQTFSKRLQVSQAGDFKRSST